MKDKELQQLLQERFQGLEMDVAPEVWQQVSAQLGHGATGATAAATGKGLLGGATGWVAAAIGVVAIAGATVLFLNNEDAGPVVQEVPVVQEAKQEANEEPQDAEDLGTTELGPTVLKDDAPTQLATTAKSGNVPVTNDPPRSMPVQSALAPGSGPADRGKNNVPLKTHDKDPAGAVAGQEPIVQPPPTPEKQHGTPTLSITKEEIEAIEEASYSDQEQPGVLQGGISGIELPLPNVFSPNSDGQNDTYLPKVKAIERVVLRAFSASNGDLVFSSEKLEPWNGRDLAGHECPPGSYFYVIEAIGSDGKVHSARQAVQLLR